MAVQSIVLLGSSASIMHSRFHKNVVSPIYRRLTLQSSSRFSKPANGPKLDQRYPGALGLHTSLGVGSGGGKGVPVMRIVLFGGLYSSHPTDGIT